MECNVLTIFIVDESSCTRDDVRSISRRRHTMDIHRGRPDHWVSHSSMTLLTCSSIDEFDFRQAWSFAWYSHTAVTSNWALANVDPTSFLIHEYKYDYFRGLENHCPHEVYCSLNLNCKNKFLHRLTPPPHSHTIRFSYISNTSVYHFCVWYHRCILGTHVCQRSQVHPGM